MMPYSTRNPFYLRISKRIVLPVYVYLDERHVNWMSDVILQHVLSDLRPHVLSKLKSESDNVMGGPAAQKKASTVDTHRGETYQFCYFIRKTEPHSVVIKSRTYHAAPKRSLPAITSSSSKKRGKRNELVNAARSKKRRVDNTGGDEDYIDPDDEDLEITGGEEEPPIELEIEEEEEKPKPILGLRYQGFSIYGQCLCIVVEPWPVQRSMTVAPVFKQSKQSAQSSSGQQPAVRASTPLFLPEEPEQHERPTESASASTPQRSHINQAYLDQVLKEGEVSDDEDDIGGMMELSQILHSIGDSRPGAINDDEDMDGSILFGDADEFREL